MNQVMQDYGALHSNSRVDQFPLQRASLASPGRLKTRHGSERRYAQPGFAPITRTIRQLDKLSRGEAFAFPALFSPTPIPFDRATRDRVKFPREGTPLVLRNYESHSIRLASIRTESPQRAIIAM